MPRRRVAGDLAPEPVSSIDEAISWLFTYSHVEDWLFDDVDLPIEARLVCDIYWLSPVHLRRKMRDIWHGAMRVARPPSADRFSRSY